MFIYIPIHPHRYMFFSFRIIVIIRIRGILEVDFIQTPHFVTDSNVNVLSFNHNYQVGYRTKSP